MTFMIASCLSLGKRVAGSWRWGGGGTVRALSLAPSASLWKLLSHCGGISTLQTLERAQKWTNAHTDPHKDAIIIIINTLIS